MPSSEGSITCFSRAVIAYAIFPEPESNVMSNFSFPSGETTVMFCADAVTVLRISAIAVKNRLFECILEMYLNMLVNTLVSRARRQSVYKCMQRLYFYLFHMCFFNVYNNKNRPSGREMSK